MSEDKLMICPSCGGSKKRHIFITRRDADCFNFSASFRDQESATNYLNKIGCADSNIITETIDCSECNDFGLVPYPSCSFCNDAKEYVILENNIRHIRDCEACHKTS